MAKFKISYGVGGGYNSISEEVIEANTLEEAQEIAYEQAISVFDSYSIYEKSLSKGEEGNDDDYMNCVDSWIRYSAEPV